MTTSLQIFECLSPGIRTNYLLRTTSCKIFECLAIWANYLYRICTGTFVLITKNYPILRDRKSFIITIPDGRHFITKLNFDITQHYRVISSYNLWWFPVVDVILYSLMDDILLIKSLTRRVNLLTEGNSWSNALSIFSIIIGYFIIDIKKHFGNFKCKISCPIPKCVSGKTKFIIEFFCIFFYSAFNNNDLLLITYF